MVYATIHPWSRNRSVQHWRAHVAGVTHAWLTATICCLLVDILWAHTLPASMSYALLNSWAGAMQNSE